MVKYTFWLTLKNTNSVKPYEYVLDLTDEQENYPERVFTPERKKQIQSALQKQTGCIINKNNLEKIISAWQTDISEGYKLTQKTLDFNDLLPMEENNLQDLEDSGNQELPELIPPNLQEIEPLFGVLPPLNFA